MTGVYTGQAPPVKECGCPLFKRCGCALTDAVTVLEGQIYRSLSALEHKSTCLYFLDSRGWGLGAQAPLRECTCETGTVINALLRLAGVVKLEAKRLADGD